MRKKIGLLLGIFVFSIMMLFHAQETYASCNDITMYVGNKESIDAAQIDDYWNYTDGTYVNAEVTGYKSSNENVATVSKKGIVHAIEAGTTEIEISYKYKLKNKVVRESETITVTVDEKPVEEYTDYNLQDSAIAKGCEGRFVIPATKIYDYQTGKYVSPTFEWEIDDSSIVRIKATNKKQNIIRLKAQKKGQTTVNVKYVYQMYDEVRVYTGSMLMYVTEPKMENKTIGINTYGGGSTEFQITGVSEASSVVCESSSPNVHVSSWKDWDDTSKITVNAYGKKKGQYTVIFNVDGKKFKRNVIIFKAYFKRATGSVDCYMDKQWHQNETMLPVYKGEKVKLKLVSTIKSPSVKWKSSDKSVVTVSKDGTVTGKGDGYATITAYVDGAPISYEIGVASKPAIKAVKEAAKVYGAEYSQEKRMKKGYYDCSSYVWRTYHAAGTDLSGGNGWAPTAADLGKWCNEKGYILMKDYISADDLLPGDLIFETGDSNGRYEGIYHVDLYVGKSISLTVNRYKSWWSGDGNVMVARPCPSKATVTASSKSGVNNVKWNVRYGATAYEIYRSTSKNGNYSKVAVMKGYTNTSYQDTSVKKGTTYYYKVRPYWKNGKKYNGKYTEPATVKTK